jgi:hypothetical protein
MDQEAVGNNDIVVAQTCAPGAILIMITYKAFVVELRCLEEEAAHIRNQKRMHEDSAFRKWRIELESLVRQVKQAGYQLPCPVKSPQRNFGHYEGSAFDDEEDVFASYQQEMADTINELRIIITSYEKHGDPPREKTANAQGSTLRWPEKITWPWLRDNVPVPLWIKGGVVLVTVLVAVAAGAYKVGRHNLVARLLGEASSPSLVQQSPSPASITVKVVPGDEPKQRHLTSGQKEKLLNALKPLATSIPSLVVFSEGTAEQVRYLWDFMEVLKRNGINLIGPLPGAAESPTEKGVMVGVPNPDHPSELSVQFANALRSAGLEVRFTKGASDLPTGDVDFDLFIGAQ